MGRSKGRYSEGRWVVLVVLVVWAGGVTACAEDGTGSAAQTGAETGGPGASAGVGSTDAANTPSGEVPGVMPPAMGTPGAQPGAPSNGAGDGGDDGTGGQPRPAGPMDGDAGFDAGVPAGPHDAGDAGDAGGSAVPPADIPEPVVDPVVWGYGLGTSDLPAAVAFYTEVMQMTVEKEVRRADRMETVLYATEAQRGARLVLMEFDDDRETRGITAKLVWQSDSASQVDRAASSHPDYVSRLSFGIVQFDGPDTYVQEVGGIFDPDGRDIDVPYLIALGFSVSDLAAARRFYTTGLHMDESPTGTFSVRDVNGSGTITEYTLVLPGGPGLVVQDWTPERNSKDNPVKVVVMVPDAQAAADEVVAAGGMVLEPASRSPVYDNRLLVVAKDPDGYLLELVQ